MSVLEGGIYFDELVGLPSQHLALLVLGLLLALLGAIFMGIAGFVAGERAPLVEYLVSSAGCTTAIVPHTSLLRLRAPAEKPEHIFHYSAAASELAAADGGGQALSPPPSMVHVIVEKNTTGRVDRLSSPVLRAGSQKNGYFQSSSSGTGADVEAGKRWWQQDGSSGVTQVGDSAGCCLPLHGWQWWAAAGGWLSSADLLLDSMAGCCAGACHSLDIRRGAHRAAAAATWQQHTIRDVAAVFGQAAGCTQPHAAAAEPREQ